MNESLKKFIAKNKIVGYDVDEIMEYWHETGSYRNEPLPEFIIIPVLGQRCLEKAKESIYFEEEKNRWFEWSSMSKSKQKKFLKEVEPEPPDGNVSWLFLASIFLGEKKLINNLKKLDKQEKKVK